MQKPTWLVAYSFSPGRYYVVHLEQPVWFYTFDHVHAEKGCEFRAHSLRYLTKGMNVVEPVEPTLVVEAHTVQPAFTVFYDVLAWFEPVPFYEEPKRNFPAPLWVFGTTPETCHDQRKLIGLRVHEAPFELAVLSFDKDGLLLDCELSDDDFLFEVQEAIEWWSGCGMTDRTRDRFRFV